MLETGICYIIIINHSVGARKMKGFFPRCLCDLGFGHFELLFPEDTKSNLNVELDALSREEGLLAVTTV